MKSVPDGRLSAGFLGRTMLGLAMCILIIGLACPAQVEFAASYLYSTPAKADPGNEITQEEAIIKIDTLLVNAAKSGFLLTAGFTFQEDKFSFDDPQLADVKVVKYKVPVTATFRFSDRTSLVAGLAPGLHGESGGVTRDDYRTEGQAFTIYRQTDHLQWLLGVGYGDYFGAPTFFPIMGFIWQSSDKLKWDLVFPMFSATYAASENLHLIASAKPAGGQWRWAVTAPSGLEVI
jgi:hypothetical protein